MTDKIDLSKISTTDLINEVFNRKNALVIGNIYTPEYIQEVAINECDIKISKKKAKEIIEEYYNADEEMRELINEKINDKEEKNE